MKTLHFEDYECFADFVSEKFEEIHDYDCDHDISIIAKYDDAKEIIRELIFNGYDIRDIELSDKTCSEYYDEYIITIVDIDENPEIWCAPMKYDGHYVDIDSMIMYIMDNCSSKVIPHCIHGLLIEVNIGNDDDNEEYCDGNCDECVLKKNTENHGISTDAKKCSKENANVKTKDAPEVNVDYKKDDKDNMHGFTASRSTNDSIYTCSFYTSDALSDGMIRTMLKDFGF